MTVVRSTNWQVMDMGMPERRCARRNLGPDLVTVLTITAAALSLWGGKPISGGDYLA